MAKEAVGVLRQATKNTLVMHNFHELPGSPNTFRAVSDAFRIPGFGRRNLTSVLDVHLTKDSKDFIFDPLRANESRMQVSTFLRDPVDEDSTIGYRTYYFTPDQEGHVLVTSFIRINGQYQGHGIGKALMHTSYDVIRFVLDNTPELSGIHVDAMITDQAEGEEPKAEGGPLPERNSWTSAIAQEMGYTELIVPKDEPRTFVKNFH